MPLCPHTLWRTGHGPARGLEHAGTQPHTRAHTWRRHTRAHNTQQIHTHTLSLDFTSKGQGTTTSRHEAKNASQSFCVFARVVSDRPQRAQHRTVKPSQACGSRTEQSADAAVVDSSSSRAEHAAFSKGLDTVPSVGDGTGAGAPGAGGSRARAGSGAEAGA